MELDKTEAGDAPNRPTSTQETLDELGKRIVEGAPGHRAGDVLSMESVAQELEVSKPMAREALQALRQMGMIKIQQRVGATVQDLEHWDVLSPPVIRWRLSQPSCRHVQRSLAELRKAIEPAAAGLAAQRVAANACHGLLHLARQLVEIGLDSPFEEADRARYRDVDAQFHVTLLTASGNEAFRSLAHPIVVAMNHRIDQQWARTRRTPTPPQPAIGAGGVKEFPPRPEPISLWFHLCLAQAIAQGLPNTSETFAKAILAEIDDELLTNRALREAVLHGLNELDLDDADRQRARAELDTTLAAARAQHQADMGWEQQ